MKTPKEEIRNLLDTLPENASLEDIQYHIYLRQKVQKGLEAAERGKVFSQEEAERQMDKWTEK